MSAAWPTRAETTLAALAADWGGLYDVTFDGGMYRAQRYDGTQLTPARTPEALGSVLRADWARRLALRPAVIRAGRGGGAS